MHLHCWILTHFLTTVCGLTLWTFILLAMLFEADRPKQLHTYLTIEELIFSIGAFGFFVGTRIAQGYYSLRLLSMQPAGQVRMGRSYQSQLVTAIYVIVYAFSAFFVLRNHNNAAKVRSADVSSALHFAIATLYPFNCILIVEQFGDPETILCCDKEDERTALDAIELVSDF